MTASALAVLGCAESSISFAYDQNEVKEMWEGLSDQAKEGAEAVLLGYIHDKGAYHFIISLVLEYLGLCPCILLAAEEKMPGTR